MKVAVFNTKPYDREFLESRAASFNHQLTFFKAQLDSSTAALAHGFPCVCVFVHDHVDEDTVRQLAAGGTSLVALRCAGFNNVDLKACKAAGIKVVRVPAYSPHAVAEHTIALLLGLNRKIYRAHARVREGNFSLEGLLGFDVHGKTVGVIGTGKIGACVAQILLGFGCTVLAHDPYENEMCKQQGVRYVALETLYATADIITLHCPLTPQSYHLINRSTISQMKDGVMIINTSRGALIDTLAVIEALKSGKIGNLGLDVYEEEDGLFFEDLSNTVIQDDSFSRLLTFPNVLITGHQAFFTNTALENIVETTLENISAFEKTGTSVNEVALS